MSRVLDSTIGWSVQQQRAGSSGHAASIQPVVLVRRCAVDRLFETSSEFREVWKRCTISVHSTLSGCVSDM